MTFTCIARDAATGELGIATATRSLAVGVRVPHVSRLGAVAIMAIADYRLGRLAQDLLANGCPAEAVIDGLVATDPHPEYRQLGVIDAQGRAAARTGRENRDFAGHHVRDGLIALGNVLVGEHVLDAIEAGFAGDTLAERLLAALEAGGDAGGQHGGAEPGATRAASMAGRTRPPSSPGVGTTSPSSISASISTRSPWANSGASSMPGSRRPTTIPRGSSTPACAPCTKRCRARATEPGRSLPHGRRRRPC